MDSMKELKIIHQPVTTQMEYSNGMPLTMFALTQLIKVI